jgi:hypothetical protein
MVDPEQTAAKEEAGGKEAEPLERPPGVLRRAEQRLGKFPSLLVVAGIVVAIAVGIATLVESRSTAQPPSSTAQAPTSTAPPGCQVNGQPANVSAIAADQFDFSHTFYDKWVTDDKNLGIHVSGRMDSKAPLPPGHFFRELAHPDPKTKDTFGNPGNDRYFPGPTITPDVHGCWDLGTTPIGHKGSQGLIWDFDILLVDEATAKAFDDYRDFQHLHPTLPYDGLTSQEVTQFKPKRLATYHVQS